MSRLDSLVSRHKRVPAGGPIDLDFLAGGGEIGALMRAHDWSTSPLGPTDAWPQSLRAVVGLLLNSKFPMFLAWGPDLAFLYNDGYAPILGSKHPTALGRRFQDIWFEIWNDISPLVDRALAGEATFHENMPLTMLRKGFEEETYFTFSYSPVRDESGGIAGLFCACTETTGQVLAEEARHNSEERYRSFIAHSSEGIWRLELDPPLDTSLPVDQQVELAYRNGRFAECNDVMARMYGLASAEDVVGRTLDFMLPASDPASKAYLAEVIRAGYSMTDVESVERDAAGQAVYFSNSMVGVVEHGCLKHVWGIQRDISERKRAEEHKTLLINELNHRVKNTLATVQSIAAQTLRNAPSTEQARAAFESRLLALSRAHDVLTRENWEGAGLARS